MKKTPQKVFKSLFDQSFIITVAIMVVSLYTTSFLWSPFEITETSLSQTSPIEPIKGNMPSADHFAESRFDKEVATPSLENNPTEVPRIFAVNLPTELGTLTNIKNKQEMFVATLLPHILKYNEDILADRTYLLRLKRIVDKGKTLSFEQRLWLKDLAKRYNTKGTAFEELVKRVDIIPPSLALGQAVVESGWGGCKYARKQNSPFGLMKDKQRLMTFDSLYEGVKTYMDNLNKHPAYDSLRRIRAQQRHDGLSPCSLKLADGLLYYSIRRHAYTRQLKEIIDIHAFKKYDHARLTTDLKS